MRPLSPLAGRPSFARPGITLVETVAAVVILGLVAGIGGLYLRDNKMTGAAEAVALSDLVRLRTESGLRQTGSWERSGGLTFSTGVTPVVVSESGERFVAVVKPSRGTRVCGVVVTPTSSMTPRCGVPEHVPAASFSVSSQDVTTPDGPRVAWTLRATPALTGSWPVAVPTGALAPNDALAPNNTGTGNTGTGNTGSGTSGDGTSGEASEATIAWTLPTGETVTLGSTDSTLLSTGITRLLTPTQAANARDAGLMVVSGSGRVRADGGGPTTVVVGTFTSIPTGTAFLTQTPIVFDATGLTVAGVAPTVWQWSFGDGTFSSLRQTTKTFTTAGTRTVTLRMVTAGGVIADAQTRVITLTTPAPPVGNLAPVAVMNSNLVWVTTNTTVIMSGLGSSDPNAATGDAVMTYAFNNGAGSSRTASSSPSFSTVYRSPGTFTARLTVTDRSGMAHTTTRSITVSTLAAPLSVPLSIATPATPSFIPGDSAMITVFARNVNNLTLTGTMPTASLSSGSPDLTVSAVSGSVSGPVAGALASKAFIVKSTIPGLYTVTPSLNGQAMAPISVNVVSSGFASNITLTSKPDTVISRTATLTPLVFQLRDPQGNTVAVAGRSVTLALITWAPLSSPVGLLSGTTTATTNASGVATFTGVMLTGNSGSASLSATATGIASPATTSIVVRNSAPTSGSVSCGTSTATLSSLTCSATAGTDAESDATSVEFETTNGTQSGTGLSRSITRGTPGTASVRIRTSDVFGNTSAWSTISTLTFTNQAPTAPVITCVPVSLLSGATSTCSVTTAGSDVDGGTLGYTWSAEGRTSAATGSSATYSSATPGTVSVTANTTDGQGGTSPVSTARLVTYTNQEPTQATIICSPLTALAGVERTCSVVTPSTDPDGGVIQHRWSSNGGRTGPEFGLTTTYRIDVPGDFNVAVGTFDGQGGYVVSNLMSLSFQNRPPTAPGVTCSPMNGLSLSDISCAITTLSVDPDGEGAITAYNWSTGNVLGWFGGQNIGLSKIYRATSPQSFDVIVTVFDVQGGSTSTTVSVTATNRSPTLGTLSCSPLSASTGLPVTCVATGFSDPDASGGADVIRYEYEAYDAGWALIDTRADSNSPTATFTFTQPGSYVVQTRVRDTQGSPWSAWISADAVSALNIPPTAPVISCSPTTTQTGTSSTCSIQTPSTDADGGVISYTWSATGRTGSATGNSTTYRLNSPGTAAATATATDGQGGSSSSSNAITLTFTNQLPTAPVILCSPLSTPTGTASTCSIATPSTDEDGGVIAYTWSSTNRTGAATGTSTTYSLATPGTSAATATAADGQGGTSAVSNSVTMTFTNQVPTAPVISCAPLSTPTGSASTCSIATPSTDADGGVITYTWSAANRTGAATGTSTTYSLATPGTAAATATAADGQGGTSPASNSVTMTFTNRAPTAPVISCAPLSTPTGTASTCSIATVSTDPDGGTISYTWSSTNRTGAATGNSTTYSLATPGTAAATATAADGQGGTSASSNSVTMTFSNQLPTAPVISCSPLSTPTGSASTCSIATPSTDADGGVLAYTWSSTNRTGAATGTSTTYSLATPGTSAATATAADGQGGTSVTSNSVTMTFTNRPPTMPVVTCTPSSRDTGTTTTCSVTTASTDPDGGTIGYNWSATDRTGGGAGISTTYLRTTPGTTAVTLSATDGQGGGQDVNVNLVFTNRAPTAPSISCSPTSVLSGQSIACTASGGADPDGGTVTYDWSIDGSVALSGVGNSVATITNAQPKAITAFVRTRDNQTGTPGGEAFSGYVNQGGLNWTNRRPGVPVVTLTKSSLVVNEVFGWTITTAGDPEGHDVNLLAHIYNPITWESLWNNESGWLTGGGAKSYTFSTLAISAPGSYYIIPYVRDNYDNVYVEGQGLFLTVVANGP